MRRIGQIIRKGKQAWLVRVTLGRDLRTGRRLYKSWVVHGPRRNAVAELNEALVALGRGTFVAPARITVDDLLDKWLPVVGTRVTPRTLRGYEEALDRYVRPDLGSRRLDRLTPLDVQGLVSDLVASGLSPRTVRMAASRLSAALRYATRVRLIGSNPAQLIDLPRMRRREPRVLSREEASRFLRAVVGDRFEVLFVIALATGMRPGELLALAWSAVNFAEATVTVCRSLSGDEAVPFKEPKTDRGRRVIPVSPTAMRALGEHRKAQAAQKLAVGGAYARDLDLVFANEDGRPLDQRNLVQRFFKPALKRAGLPSSIRMYDLRHTSATLMIEAGVHLRIIADRLGHADPAFTLSTYVHATPPMAREAAERVEEILFR